MRANNVLGLIFSDTYDSALPEMTSIRSMGSIPFCGRYRLIDFALSNFVNCGISKVGVITGSNYQSLMNHLGTGKAWDLSRKNEGMYILPPFCRTGSSFCCHRIEALSGIRNFIRHSKEEYVILCDCNVICNLNIKAMLNFHTESNADITVAYTYGNLPNLPDLLSFEPDSDGRIVYSPASHGKDGKTNYSLNIFVLRKALLETLINESLDIRSMSFERDIIRRNLGRLRIMGYNVSSFNRTVDSLRSYYSISMELLNPENTKTLFNPNRPVLTKVRDDFPAVYGLGSSVKNSLVANGCVIDGEVENCIIFRGVRISKGARVRNSIIMQNGFIGESSQVCCSVTDKNCSITSNKNIIGDIRFPIYIGKGRVI